MPLLSVLWFSPARKPSLLSCPSSFHSPLTTTPKLGIVTVVTDSSLSKMLLIKEMYLNIPTQLEVALGELYMKATPDPVLLLLAHGYLLYLSRKKLYACMMRNDA